MKTICKVTAVVSAVGWLLSGCPEGLVGLLGFVLLGLFTVAFAAKVLFDSFFW